jgi:hypothetical protein
MTDPKYVDIKVYVPSDVADAIREIATLSDVTLDQAASVLAVVGIRNLVSATAEVQDEESATLDGLLNDWAVMAPGTWENDDGPEDWYAVTDANGIVAYFGNEDDAMRFRLAEINRALNG